MAKVGRPVKENKRTEVIKFRVTPEEKKLIQKMFDDRSVSEVVREMLLKM